MRRLSPKAVGQPPGCLVQPFGRGRTQCVGIYRVSLIGPLCCASSALAEGKDGEACLSELQSDSERSTEDVSGRGT